MWLVENKCGLGKNKIESTYKLLLCALFHDRGRKMILTDKYFDYIKKLFDYGVFETNLIEHVKLESFNPAYYTDNLEILK